MPPKRKKKTTNKSPRKKAATVDTLPPADGGKVRKISPGFDGNSMSEDALLTAMSEREIRKAYIVTKHYIEYCLANYDTAKDEREVYIPPDVVEGKEQEFYTQWIPVKRTILPTIAHFPGATFSNNAEVKAQLSAHEQKEEKGEGGMGLIRQVNAEVAADLLASFERIGTFRTTDPILCVPFIEGDYHTEKSARELYLKDPVVFWAKVVTGELIVWFLVLDGANRRYCCREMNVRTFNIIVLMVLFPMFVHNLSRLLGSCAYGLGTDVFCVCEL